MARTGRALRQKVKLDDDRIDSNDSADLCQLFSLPGIALSRYHKSTSLRTVSDVVEATIYSLVAFKSE